MFRRREKKVFPPGTFIPTPARLCAIIQLCICFTLILWYLSQPFMGELFTYKSKALIFKTIMGQADTPSAKNLRDADRFSQLPIEQQQRIRWSYEELNRQAQKTFGQKISRSLRILMLEIPPITQAWIFFALLISILLLKKVEGARDAAWLLPLIALVYCIDNSWYGKPSSITEEARLFPSEEYLVKNYLQKPLGSRISEQKEQLEHGWHLYLVSEWARETPSPSQELFLNQIEQGEFNFNVARAEKIAVESTQTTLFYRKEASFILGFYLFWNLLFALIIQRSLKIYDGSVRSGSALSGLKKTC
jgi:hypothetical protein